MEAKVTEGRVDLFVPKGYANDEPNLFIAVNGESFLIPKGKTSKVPPYVKEEYERGLRAQQKMDEHVDQMLEAAK